MEVSGRVFVLAVVCFLTHNDSLSFAMEYRYVNEGENVTLPCSADNASSSSWCGRNELFRNRSISIFVGLEKNPLLTYLDNIQITKEEDDRRTYNLVLANISPAIQGVYTCEAISNGVLKQEMYTIVFIENPSVVEIINNGTTIDGTIIGTENESTEIVCRAKDNISAINISWYKTGMSVESKVSNTLAWSFVPTRSDNNMTVSCVVYIPDLDKPLVKTTFLDIRYFQMNFSTSNTKEVIEGHSFNISCYGDGNPSVGLIQIRKGTDCLRVCLESSCSVLLNGTRYDSGTYICSAQTSLGDEYKCNITIDVLYPPDVTVIIQDTTLQCEAKGNPNNISFVAWQHYSELGEIIRTFPGSEYLQFNISYKRYEINGGYSCEVKNGIPDIGGNIIRSGKYPVEIDGTPEILPNTKMIQYGKYHEPLSVIIFVYSVPPITSAGLYNTETNAVEKTINVTWLYRNFSIVVFEKQVVLKGYEIHFQIKSQSDIKSDVGNYTFIIENKRGRVSCTIFLQNKDAKPPSPPLLNAVYPKDGDVLLSFKQTSKDDNVQQFIVEYRKVYETSWTLAYIINKTLEEPYFVTIYGLEYDVEYCVEVFALNDVGRSNSTQLCSIVTANNSTYLYTFIMLPVAIICLCTYFGFRKRRTMQSWILKFRRNSGSHHDNDQNEQELQDSPPLDSPRMAHNEMFPMPNRNLAYVELDLNVNTGRFLIRGEERTNYSDIEYFRVGPPASSSSSEDGDDGREKDNDEFMSLEEIADMMKSRGADALSDCD